MLKSKVLDSFMTTTSARHIGVAKALFDISSICITYCFLNFYLHSDVDMSGITEVSVNNTTYQVMNGSTILQSDAKKYHDSCFSVDSVIDHMLSKSCVNCNFVAF